MTRERAAEIALAIVNTWNFGEPMHEIDYDLLIIRQSFGFPIPKTEELLAEITDSAMSALQYQIQTAIYLRRDSHGPLEVLGQEAHLRLTADPETNQYTEEIVLTLIAWLKPIKP